MGGFAGKKLKFDSDGFLSDDGQSLDLDELSRQGKDLDDDEIMDMLASKHRFQDDGKILHIAIIDYLQNWNLSKKGETCAKTLLLGQRKDAVSSMPPIPYGERFLRFMHAEVFN